MLHSASKMYISWSHWPRSSNLRSTPPPFLVFIQSVFHQCCHSFQAMPLSWIIMSNSLEQHTRSTSVDNQFSIRGKTTWPLTSNNAGQFKLNKSTGAVNFFQTAACWSFCNFCQRFTCCHCFSTCQLEGHCPHNWSEERDTNLCFPPWQTIATCWLHIIEYHYTTFSCFWASIFVSSSYKWLYLSYLLA